MPSQILDEGSHPIKASQYCCAGWGRGLGMMLAWAGGAEGTEKQCLQSWFEEMLVLIRALCPPSIHHPLLSWGFTLARIGQIWQVSLCVFTLSLSPLQTNAHTTRWLVYLYNAHRLSSLMNAPKRSEYSACIANQCQLCTLTAPDVSSKMSHICSAVRGGATHARMRAESRVAPHSRGWGLALQMQPWVCLQSPLSWDLLLWWGWVENETCRQNTTVSQNRWTGLAWAQQFPSLAPSPSGLLFFHHPSSPLQDVPLDFYIYSELPGNG